MKIVDQEKMERIKALLKGHPRGLSITNLASITGMNRNLIAKYLDMLVISGQVEIQQYGPAKVFFLSQRIPVSAMIEITSDFVMVLDQDRKIVHVNKAFTQFLAMKRENLLGKTIGEVNHPFLSSLPLPEPSEPLDTREGGIHEVSFPGPGGESHFRIKRAPAVFEDGAVGLTLIIEDITEQRRYQENLRLSEARYRGIVQDQTEFIDRFLPDTTLTFVNEALSQFMNCRPEDLVGKRAIDLLPEEERSGLLKSIRALTPQNPTSISEERMKDGRGQMRWVHWTNRAIFDETGVVREIQGIGRDITEQRETAEKISRYILQLEFISRKAVEFVHPAPDADIYPIIAAGVKSLFPDALVCVHSFDPGTGAMKGQAMLDDEARFRIREILGKDPVGALIRPGDEILEKARKGTLTRIQSDAFLPSFLPSDSRGLAQLREVIGMVDIYLMGLTYRDDLLGEVVLLFRQGSAVQHEHLLVTYLNQASVAVQRQVFQEELRKSQEQYRRIIETSAEGIWVLDRDYRTTFVNPRLTEMLGYAPEELAGTQIEELMLPEDIPAHRQRVLQRKGGVSDRFEQRFRRKDGSLIWAMANATPLFEEGEFTGAFAMLTDITGEKMAEDALRESEGRYRTLIETSADGICLVNEEGNLIGCNRAMEEISGLPREEALGKPIWDIAYRITDPGDTQPALQDTMRSEVLQALRQGTSRILEEELEFSAALPDGSKRFVQVRTYAIPHGDRFRLGSIIRDVTARKAAEGALRESEERYRTLVEQAHDMIVVVQDGILKFCNQKVAAMWGGRVEEILGQPYEKFIAPEELPRVRENYTRRMAGEDVPELYDTLLLRRDGSRVHVDLSAGTILFEGKPADLVVIRDITEKREVEEQLKRNYELQQAILNASPVGIGVTTGRTLIWANHTMDEMLGYEPGELKGSPSRVLFADDEEYERALVELQQGVGARGVGTVQTAWKRKDGGRLNIFLTIATVRPGSPEIVAIAQDITDRKRIEDELKRTHDLQQAILNASPVGVGLINDHVLIWANETMARIQGIQPGVLRGQHESAAFSDKEEYERVSKEFYRGIEERGWGESETVLIRKDGSRAEISMTGTPIRPGSKEVIVVVSDITARKKVEEDLRRTSTLQEAILKASPVGIGFMSGKNLIWENPAMCHILGIEEGALRGQPVSTRFADEMEYDRATRELDRGIEQKGFGEVETVWKQKDGSLRNVHLRVSSLHPGSPDVIGVATDITRRKEAERALRESEETFRTMVSINPLPLSLIDPTGKYLHVNPAFTQLFGYTLEDIPDGKAWFALAYPDENARKEAIRLWKADARDHPPGEVRPRTFRVRCRDGSFREILFLPAATPAGLQVVVYRDITGEKIHARLRESEDLYRTLVDDLNIGIYRSSGDPDGRFIWGNTGLISILGFEDLADLKGVAVRDIFQRPGGRKVLLKELQEKKFVKSRILTLKKKNGTPVKVSVTALAEFDEKGTLQFITGLVQELPGRPGPNPGDT